jgi:hypothetical protein
MRTLRTTATGLTAVIASAALAGGAAAEPHVAAQYKLPGGLPAGGAITEGADGAMYAATGVKPTPQAASVVVRITGKGRISKIRLPVPTGMDIRGLAVGADRKVWVSGTMNAEPYTGYSGEISGTRAKLKKASDSASWSALAVVGGVNYTADGFGTISTSTDAQTFTPTPLSGSSPFALAVRGGDLFAAGDGNAEVFPAGQTAATPLVSPDAGITLGSRSLAVAHGDVWFVVEGNAGAQNRIARVAADNSVRLFTMPAPVFASAAGPGGDAWFMTAHGALRVNANGKVTGKLSLSGRSTDGIAGGPGNTLWLQTFGSGPSSSRVIKVKP